MNRSPVGSALPADLTRTAAERVGPPPRTADRRASARRASGFWSTSVALVFLCIFFVAPVLALLTRSVTDPKVGIENFVEVFGSVTYMKVFINTFMVSGLVTLVTLVFAFPVSWLLAILSPRWSSILFGIIVLSMWTNLLTRTYAWMVLLQRTGLINRTLLALHVIDAPLPLINNLTGVTVGMTYIMIPFMVLPLHATIHSLDPAVFRAASLCGASRSQVFFRLFLPLCATGIASGCLMVFVMALGYFVTPSFLGGTSNMMLAELIAQLVQSLLEWGLAGTAALVLLVVTLALYAVQLKYLGLYGVREVE